jgi:succinylarginine dihydrolase
VSDAVFSTPAGSQGAAAALRELNFDGLPGPAHNHAGLSPGNLASMRHGGLVANPRAAALEGLAKMRLLHSLGVGQAVLPPHERPLVSALRRLGFVGSDAEVLSTAAQRGPELLRLCSSSSAMWTANAATIAPSSDTLDGRLHITVANLSHMFHRSLEAPTTERVLSAIFADRRRFAVHTALPNGPLFSDEGAANHTRLGAASGTVHLFGWGRRSFGSAEQPRVHPARQTLEASMSVARLNRLRPEQALYWQQAPHGIDSGSFHSDVLAVGNQGFLLLHEHAFVDAPGLLAELGRRLGHGFGHHLVSDAELPVANAVAAYPFNSQLVTLPSGRMALIAPADAERDPASKRALARLLAEHNPVAEIHFVEVNGSMKNGGGPACLRLRVPLTADESAAIGARVLFDEDLHQTLQRWIERHYRDRLAPADLADPALLRETREALDELTQLLDIGSVYEFQS